MLAALLAISIVAQCDTSEEPSLPLVYEQVDQIWFVSRPESDYTTVVFIRDNKVVATRLYQDDMLIVAQGESFQLIWRDWTAERVVECAEIRGAILEPIPAPGGGEWWQMQNRMVDLKQP